ncbi:hypothetical protein [Pseudomonas fluorescens]|uniref:hypothetical protein n=1 Tax=Pseudomonas fluorescens TaxID=294 RepID=UPI001784A1AB|nr:hypothetical protein [Pseudomonas fluorescens]
MSNDLVTLDGGEIQPFSPSPPLQELQPLSPSPDTWGHQLTNPERDQFQYQPEITLFGADLPPGTTKHQVDAVLGDLSRVFQSDFQTLGYPQKLISIALYFIRENATKKPYKVVQRHNFNLHGNDDWLGTAFANHLVGCPGTNREKQQFLTACLQWLAKANAKLNTNVGTTPAQGRASNSTESLLNSLSDSDYAAVIEINNRALANTMLVLQQRWGEYTYQQNIQIAQNYLDSLPANEQRHFDQFTTGWVHMRNTPEFIIAMFDAATGAHNIPTSGGAVQAEINQIESLMRTPATRRAYMNDPQLQGRLRTLYNIRDKG